jgi:hypothetical protein
MRLAVCFAVASLCPHRAPRIIAGLCSPARRLRRSARVARTRPDVRRLLTAQARKLPEAEASILWDRRHEEFAESLYRLAVDLKGPL